MQPARKRDEGPRIGPAILLARPLPFRQA